MDVETIQFLLELAIAFAIACVCLYTEKLWKKRRQADNRNKLTAYFTLHNARLEKAWRNMEEGDCDVSPFLYFDYMKYIFRCTARKLSVRPMIVCVESADKEILMIAPVKKYIFSNKLKMLGDTQGCGHTDFLFKPGLSEEEIDSCLNLFMDRYGRKFYPKRLCENSALNAYLTKQVEASLLSEAWPCVRLSFTEDIDLYIGKLSASVRQNQRTAYNRTRRDGIEYELKVWMPQSHMAAQDWNKLTATYLQRLLTKYKKRKAGSFFYKFYKTAYYKYIKHDSLSLRRAGNAFHAALFVQGECMCFMSGFANHEETRVVIPRLAIQDAYRFYSPGYLLICETMKWLINHSSIREIDLSRGTERYKTDLGGKFYHTHAYHPTGHPFKKGSHTT